MKKVLIGLVAILLVTSGTCFALGDNNNNSSATATGGSATGGAGGAGGSASNNIGNVSGSGNKSFSPSSDANAIAAVHNDVDLNNKNVNVSKNTNVNKVSNKVSNKQKQQQGQGQLQGQGQQQLGQVGTGNEQATSFTDNSKTYAFAPPAINGEKGTSPLNAYSIFGGIGMSSTEQYAVCIEKISVIERLEGKGYITREEAIAEARNAFAQMKGVTKDKRFLGVLWKTSGRDLLNGLGLLSWDSFWSGSEFNKTEPKEQTESSLKSNPTVNYNK